MGKKRRLGVTVSAMILAAQLGSPLAAQQASLEQLTAIASLLTANDVAGLRTFLEANPELLEGETQLALLLRRFMAASTDLATFLGFEPDLSDAFGALAVRPAPAPAPAPSPTPQPAPPAPSPPPPDDGPDPDDDDGYL